jgi:hypothetical protein
VKQSDVVNGTATGQAWNPSVEVGLFFHVIIEKIVFLLSFFVIPSSEPVFVDLLRGPGIDSQLLHYILYYMTLQF